MGIIMKTYIEFKNIVKSLCNKEDYKNNHKVLKEIRISSYDTFTKMLRLGGEIIPSKKASEEIFKLSTKTPFKESELVELSMRFRFINELLYMKHY